MTLISRAIRISDVVVDSSTKFNAARSKAIKAAGANVIVRYVFFGIARPQDLDAGERQILLGDGHTVIVICHVPNPSWQANAADGADHSKAAISNAIKAGYVTPSGNHPIALGLDMEGVGDPGPSSIAYAQVSFQSRVQANYQALGYNGFDSGETAAACDGFNADPSCGGADLQWWCDAAALSQRPVPKKGYTLHQKAQSTLAGIGVDVDTVLIDGVLYGLADADLIANDSDDAAGQSAQGAA